MHRNAGEHNNTEWAESTLIPFSMGSVAHEKSKLEYKVCHSIPVCMVLCHARIIYVHSISSEMARACIHLGVHDHPLANGTCRES